MTSKTWVMTRRQATRKMLKQAKGLYSGQTKNSFRQGQTEQVERSLVICLQEDRKTRDKRDLQKTLDY